MTALDALSAAVRDRLLAAAPAHLPGLGTFERAHVPARVAERPDGSRTMLPPGETVRFVNGAEGDRSLARALVSRPGVKTDPDPGVNPGPDALDQAIEALLALLAARGEVHLRGVGLLRRDERALAFAPERLLTAEINEAYGGLAPVALAPPPRAEASATAEASEAQAEEPSPPSAEASASNGESAPGLRSLAENPDEPSAEAFAPDPETPSPSAGLWEGEPQGFAEASPDHEASSGLGAESPESTSDANPAAEASEPSAEGSEWAPQASEPGAEPDALSPALPEPSSEAEAERAETSEASEASPTPLFAFAPDPEPDGPPSGLHTEAAHEAMAPSGPEAPAPPSPFAFDDAFDEGEPEPSAEGSAPPAEAFAEISAPFDEASDPSSGGPARSPEPSSPFYAETDEAHDAAEASGEASPEGAFLGADDLAVSSEGAQEDPGPTENIDAWITGAWTSTTQPAPPPAPPEQDPGPDPFPMAFEPAPVIPPRAAAPREALPPPRERRSPAGLYAALGVGALVLVALLLAINRPRPAPEASLSPAPAAVPVLEEDPLAQDFEDAEASDPAFFDLDEAPAAPEPEPSVASAAPRPPEPEQVPAPAPQQASPAPRPAPAGPADASGLSEPDAAALTGDAPIETGGPGFTWVLNSTPSQADAERQAARYRQGGFRTRVIPATAGGQTVYRVAVGQFASRDHALRLRSRLPADAPRDAWTLGLGTD